MIRIRRDSIPLIQQLDRSIHLRSNNSRSIRTQRHTNRNLPALRRAALRQNINQHPRPLDHIPRLVVIHSLQHFPKLSDRRLIVLLNPPLTLDLGPSIQEPGAKVPWLSDGHSNAQRSQLRMHGLGNTTACPFGASIESVAGIAVPGPDTPEVADGPVAGGDAHVREEGFGDVEHAEYVGVELIEVLFGAMRKKEKRLVMLLWV